MMIVEIQKKSKNSKKHTACMKTKYSANQEDKIPSELELAPHFHCLHCLYYSNSFTLLKQKHVCLYNIHIHCKARLELETEVELLSKMWGEY